jgi:hypothetical protein
MKSSKLVSIALAVGLGINALPQNSSAGIMRVAKPVGEPTAVEYNVMDKNVIIEDLDGDNIIDKVTISGQTLLGQKWEVIYRPLVSSAVQEINKDYFKNWKVYFEDGSSEEESEKNIRIFQENFDKLIKK